jgi:hypothetical protein
MEAVVKIEGLEAVVAGLVQEAVDQALVVRADNRPMDSEAAGEYLGVSRRRIHDLVNEGKLPRRSEGPGCKLWFTRADLDEYALGRRRLSKPSNEGGE